MFSEDAATPIAPARPATAASSLQTAPAQTAPTAPTMTPSTSAPRSRREARERERAALTTDPIRVDELTEAPVFDTDGQHSTVTPGAAAASVAHATTSEATTPSAGETSAYPSRRAMREALRTAPEAQSARTASVPSDRGESLENRGSSHSAASLGHAEPVRVHETATASGADEARASSEPRERPALRTPSPARGSSRPNDGLSRQARRARRVKASRGPAFVAGSAVLALIPSLMIAAPANAATTTLTPEQLQATIDSNTRVLSQKLAVSGNVATDDVQAENYVASAIAGIVAAESGPDGAQVAVSLADALQYGGAREKIVEKALTYLGDPYELGGSSHDGIDCSGLTMVSYATVGISLAHYVPSQDAVATTISQAEAQPGDLVFFDDDEHVALYLGGGMIIEAPDYGIPVRIVSLSTWSGIGYHFGRILKD